MRLGKMSRHKVLLILSLILLSSNAVRRKTFQSSTLTRGSRSCNIITASLDYEIPKREKSFPGQLLAFYRLEKSKVSAFLQSGAELDGRVFSLFLPAVVNFAIIPLVGAVDTYWVGRMREALALAGQGAANQIFSSSFWIISFLPSVITPLLAKTYGSGDMEGFQDRAGEAIFVSLCMGAIGMVFLTAFSSYALSLVLANDSPARFFAQPYLKIRAITFIPALLSTVCYAIFRGTMDIFTPLKISLISNLINIVADPIMIFNLKMGVSGAAAATCISEIVSFALYTHLIMSKKLTMFSKIFRRHSLTKMMPLLMGGVSVQMRSIAMNIAFLTVTRKTQALDVTGISAAAHTISMQFWQLGGVFLLALSAVASIMVPNYVSTAVKLHRESANVIASNEATNTPSDSDVEKASTVLVSLSAGRFASNRLLLWGWGLGSFLAVCQLLCLPLLGVFSPLPEVQKSARLPALLGAVLQFINGLVFVGEGIQQGNQYFGSLALSSLCATVGMLTSLHFFGSTLTGIWGSFFAFNIIRLAGVLRHHFLDGPFTMKKIQAARDILAKVGSR